MLIALDRLLDQSPSVREEYEFVLARPLADRDEFPLANISVCHFGSISGYFWEQWSLFLFARDALVLNLCNLGPVSSRNCVTCIHDAHVWLMPDNFSLFFRLAYRIIIPLLTTGRKTWFSVSHFSAQSLLSLGVARKPASAVIGNGVSHILSVPQRRPAELPDGRFVFALGSMSKNKNISLVAALAEPLKAHSIRVVIAGGGNSAVFGSDSGACVSGNISKLNRVHDSELAYLYGHADAFIFPSYFEGFGIPPVEAMAYSCPVVSSNTSAMPEVLGDAAYFCSPDAPDQWAPAVIEICSNAELRTVMIGKGKRRANEYSWAKSARGLLDLLLSAPRV
jgi:glycosyltransferase involved in cell wall biosynthesis